MCQDPNTHTRGSNQPEILKILKIPVTTAENQVVAVVNQVATGRNQAVGGNQTFYSMEQGRNLSLSLLKVGA